MKYLVIFTLWLFLIIIDTILIKFSKNEKLKTLFSTAILVTIVLLAIYDIFVS